MREKPTFSTRACGIPCGIVIENYRKVQPWKGDITKCPSDKDYFGYTICDWHLVDRKGYYARWLERKLTQQDVKEIENAIHDYHQNQC